MNKTYTNLAQVMREIVQDRAKYNKSSFLYDLKIEDIPEIDLDRAVAVLMADESLAAEATGPDNPSWEEKMLPALYRRFARGDVSYENMEVAEEWINGIRSYMTRYIAPALVTAIDNLNADVGLTMEPAWCHTKEITYERRSNDGY